MNRSDHSDYAAKAARCRAEAEAATSAEDKKAWLEMAAKWQDMADRAQAATPRTCSDPA